MKNYKRAVSLLVVILIFTVSILGTYSLPAFNDNTEIKLKPGSSMVYINGQGYPSAKPFNRGGDTYVPLRLVLEAIGTEVNWQGNGIINLVFRDVSIDLKVNEIDATVNQLPVQLKNPPLTSGTATMVPLDFVREYFGVSVTQSEKNGFITILLDDDGALKDLSFLIGGISKPRAGNSYFGWSVIVPKGSRVTSTSFNSRYVLIENEHREVALEIAAASDNGKSIDQLFTEVEQDPSAFINGGYPEIAYSDSSRYPYIELLYNNEYDEAVVKRFYINNGYLLSFSLTSYSEKDPAKVKANKNFSDILNSFALDYNGSSEDTQDLSKIKFGLARYENYIETESGSKLSSWEMDVLPEWDVMYPYTYNPFLTELGSGRKEYISVEISRSNGSDNAETYAGKILDFYNTNFNPRLYSMMEKKTVDISGYKAYKLIYGITAGTSRYVIDESFIVTDNFVYDITIKSPADKYESQVENYNKILDSFKYYTKDSEKLISELDKHSYEQSRNRVGKDDSITEYQNKTYGWAVKMPGYWMKSSQYDNSYQSFVNEATGGTVMVEAVEKNSATALIPDGEKFGFLNTMIGMGSELVARENTRINGRSVRFYHYRLENEENDMFADVRFYVIDADNYSYCLVSAISDLCASDANNKEMQSIINSFSVVKQEKE